MRQILQTRWFSARGQHPHYARFSRKGVERGFTLMEMTVVISIILLLLAVAIPSYNRSIIRSKEGVLRQDLFTLRSVIAMYTEDKEKAPQSSQDLITAGYLKRLPVDPFTNSADTWQWDMEEATFSIDQNEPGISDVHSGSNATALDGTTYSQW
jgi:general secretion pathway protein G